MIAPSFGPLSLDFTTASLDPRITFTRALGTATVTNSSGNIVSVSADTARFDYDPVTLACKGLLIEESSTNLCAFSVDITATGWLNGSNVTVTANDAYAPDNTLTAYRRTANGATISANYSRYTYAVDPNGRTFTWSVWIKSDDGSSFSTNIRIANNGDTDGAQASVAITGSWKRFTITRTFTAASTSVRGFINYSSTPRNLHVWGAQLEEKAFATSYIPTAGAAVTRNADVATVTGSNFSDFWQAAKGGTSALYIPSTISGTRPVVQFDDGTANEIIALQGNAANPELYIVDGGTPQAQIDAGTLVAGTTHTLTGWWEPNFCAARLDNGARFVDNSATIPTVTQMRLGSDGTNYLNGHLAVVNYYDKFSGQIYARRKNKAVFSVL